MISLLKFISKNLQPSSKRKLAVVYGFTIILSVISIGLPLIQKSVLEEIEFGSIDVKVLYTLLVIGVLSGIFYLCETLLMNDVFMSLKNTFQNRFLKSVIRSESKIISEKGSGAYMVGIYGDSESLASLVKTNYLSIMLSIVSALIILIITSFWTKYYSLIIFGSYIFMILVMIFTQKTYKREFALGRSMIVNINPKLLEFIENRSSLATFSNVSKYEDSINEMFLARDKHFRRALGANIVGQSIVSVVKSIALIVFFLVAIVLLKTSQITFGEFFAMFTYFSTVFLPITAMQEVYSNISRYSVLQSKLPTEVKSQCLYLPEIHSYEVENVSYSYNENNMGNLKNISIKIDEMKGIVGLSGEGKTTLLKLMTGKLNGYTGACFIGNTNITSVSKAVLASVVRVYSQYKEMFDDTLQFNICLNKTGISASKYDDLYKDNIYFLQIIRGSSKIWDNERLGEIIMTVYNYSVHEISKNPANELIDVLNDESQCEKLISIFMAKKYYIEERYLDLVDSLNLTHLEDRDFGQRGSKVSGGEIERICMARFLLPVLDSLMIIDEPFTNIDLLREKQSLKVLRKHIEKSNGIIISHKLDIIKSLSNEVIILEGGKITSSGTFSDVVNESKLLNSLVSLSNEKI